MKEHDYKILCELKEKLSRKVRLSDMRLFGSRARGDSDEFSDFDVFIETETLDKKIRDIIKETAWEISLEYNILISSLIFSKSELTDSPLRSSSIVKNILNEGIRI
jgi:predicted nucleotidyltransferase